MRPSKVDIFKQELKNCEKELRHKKTIEAIRALNQAMLAYNKTERNIENFGFVDCPILKNIACSKEGEVMRKDWELVYTGNVIKRNNKYYQMHRIICFTFGNEENYPQEFLDLYCDVHHKNGDHKDNRASNLCFVTKEYHAMLHHQKIEFSDEIRRQLIAQQYNIYSLMFE